MKKHSFTLMVLLMAAFICHNTAFAQSDTYLHFGLSIPSGSFGSKTNNCVLYGNGAYGCADLGFNAGVKFLNHTKAEGLSVMFTVDGTYNSLQNNLKSEDNVPYEIPEIEDIPIIVRDSKYINIPIMLGLNYNLAFSRTWGMYVEAGAGINVRFITPCKITAFDYTIEQKPDYTFTKRYTTKFNFAYQFGGGITIKDAISIGVSYLDLGSALIQGTTEKLLKTADIASIVPDKEEFKYTQLSTRMFVVRLSIHLK